MQLTKLVRFSKFQPFLKRSVFSVLGATLSNVFLLVQSLIYEYINNELSIINKKIQKQPLRVFYKKCVLKNFAKFTGKHLCQSLIFKACVRYFL